MELAASPVLLEGCVRLSGKISADQIPDGINAAVQVVGAFGIIPLAGRAERAIVI